MSTPAYKMSGAEKKLLKLIKESIYLASNNNPYWSYRPSHHFKSKHDQAVWNTRHSNMMCANPAKIGGYKISHNRLRQALVVGTVQLSDTPRLRALNGRPARSQIDKVKTEHAAKGRRIDKVQKRMVEFSEYIGTQKEFFDVDTRIILASVLSIMETELRKRDPRHPPPAPPIMRAPQI